jgi:hypothetical protein
MHSCNQYVEAMERPTRRQAMGKIKVGKQLAMGLILSTQIHPESEGMRMSSDSSCCTDSDSELQTYIIDQSLNESCMVPAAH